jgi:hypothetical protein
MKKSLKIAWINNLCLSGKMNEKRVLLEKKKLFFNQMSNFNENLCLAYIRKYYRISDTKY